MNILWVCNIPLPVIAKKIGIPTSKSGGWLVGLSSMLLQTEDISLSVCFPYNGAALSGEAAGIRYASFPTEGIVKYSRKTEDALYTLFHTLAPDAIHIFGTEAAHSFAAVRAAEKCGLLDKTVVSIQGLACLHPNPLPLAQPRRAWHIPGGWKIPKSSINLKKAGKQNHRKLLFVI